MGIWEKGVETGAVMAEVVEKDKDKIQNKRIKQRNIKAFSLPVEVGTPPPCKFGKY